MRVQTLEGFQGSVQGLFIECRFDHRKLVREQEERYCCFSLCASLSYIYYVQSAHCATLLVYLFALNSKFYRTSARLDRKTETSNRGFTGHDLKLCRCRVMASFPVLFAAHQHSGNVILIFAASAAL